MTSIMLIEDNEGDVLLTKAAFKKSNVPASIVDFHDGDEALKYLRKQGPYEKTETPKMILMDINLPRRDGKQILEEIKEDPVLRRIPVIILTGSKAEKDVGACYDVYANAYLVKPSNLSEFSRIVGNTTVFWLDTVTLSEQ